MRSLVGVVVVVGLVGAFALFTIFLPRFRTGEEKPTLVRGIVLTTPAQQRSRPLTIYVALFQGRPREIDPTDSPLDEASPQPDLTGTAPGPTSFRFEFEAGPDDGPPFFVRAFVETPALDRFCADAALPSARIVDDEWRDSRTRRPLAPLRLTPSEPCAVE